MSMLRYPTVTATDAARRALSELARTAGPLVVVQSAGCCDGSAPMVLPASEFPLGAGDIEVGEVAGVPVYVSIRELRAWEHGDIDLDVETGYADGFSLTPADGLHFVSRLRGCAIAHHASPRRTTMKTAVVTSFDAPLEIQERPIPEPGPGQVLIHMETCGLCHTDIHAAHGDWPVKPTPPFVPGHEGVGTVTKLGPGVSNRSVGDRGAIPWLGHACGHCDHCVSGWETLCEEQQNSGYSVDGAFAEYAVADATYVVQVPDAVTSFDAAPLSCAGVTTYKAIKVAEISPSEKVVIFGIGGLGHLAVQYARLVGAEVIAVDVTEEKLELAKELGADHVINAVTSDPVQVITDLGGADVAVALAVSPKAFQQAFASLRRGGRLVCVALPPEHEGTMLLPIFDTVIKGIKVIGSIVGTREDLAEVFRLHALGRTRVIAEPRKLEDVNDAIDDVLHARTSARLVFQF